MNCFFDSERFVNRKRPSVILCTMQNSGASAIVPIVKELLNNVGYDFTPYGPEGSDKLFADLDNKQFSTPFFHWSHSDSKFFKPLLNDQRYRFIFLHRDPRDVAVSFNYLRRRDFPNPEISFADSLSAIIGSVSHFVDNAVGWLNEDVKVIRFNELKNNMEATIFNLLDFIDFFDSDLTREKCRADILQIIAKYSYESVANRNRGDKGELIRTGYMYRKGISGEWKKYFSQNLLDDVNRLFSDKIEQLGYLKCEGLYQLISPPFSCGITWIVNALLSLNIKMTNSSFEPEHWSEQENGWILNEAADTHLKWHLPILHERYGFNFKEPIEILWEHRLDFTKAGPRLSLLMLRDPRDAVFSFYQRHYASVMEFEDYLKRPDIWPDHFPELFRFPPFETYAYFTLFWVAMSKSMPVYVITFEEVRNNPGKLLKDVLSILDITRTDQEIERAVDSSSFENALRAMEIMEQSTGKRYKVVRSGKVEEWQQTYNDESLALFSGPCEDLFNSSGQLIEANAMFFMADSLEFISEHIKFSKHDLLLWFLSQVRNNVSFSEKELSEFILNNNLKGQDLLVFTAVLQALFYTNEIFEDMLGNQANDALMMFINVNTYYLYHEPVYNAVVERLEFIQERAGCKLTHLLNELDGMQMKVSLEDGTK